MEFPGLGVHCAFTSCSKLGEIVACVVDRGK